MALVLDTGPLYASLDRDDADHQACRSLISESQERLVIPAPVLVEIDQLVQRRLHPDVFLRLLDDLTIGAFDVEPLVDADYARARVLCERYSDSRIGFVDATVLAIVERLGEPKLATLDRRHFAMMRPRHVDALELLPR